MSESVSNPIHFAVIGGGPSALYLLKNLLDSGKTDFTLDIFEAGDGFGRGMPYGRKGAEKEHITNISESETPPLPASISEWLAALPEQELKPYDITSAGYETDDVLPRLLFGSYLESQFSFLIRKAEETGIKLRLHPQSRIIDVKNKNDRYAIEAESGDVFFASHVAICTGHVWPKEDEIKKPRCFNSPYPPSKLNIPCDHPVAVRGASLTAMDAVRTLARANGQFTYHADGRIVYEVAKERADFRLDLYSKLRLLPCVRVYMDESMLGTKGRLTDEQIDLHLAGNDGFLSLDFIFEEDFRKTLREKDPVFFEAVKNLSLEEFVAHMMAFREASDPFALMQLETAQAEYSKRTETPVPWKEILALLSFAINYPAKHLSAEDMERFLKHLTPLISLIIAFVPESSCKELLALHDAGCLDLIAAGDDNEIIPNGKSGAAIRYSDTQGNAQEKHYATFVDAIGQKHLEIEDFPFAGLVEAGLVSVATLRFRDTETAKARLESGDKKILRDERGYLLQVSGLGIDDSFRAIDKKGNAVPGLYLMAVPFLGGHNPDYSGLDFCNEASKRIVADLLS